MKVSIVIPNYNGEENLKDNLPKIYEAMSSDDFEMIIVDDFSKDNSLELIRKFADGKNGKVKFEMNPKNMGFSSTVNRGVAMSSGEILILLNTDVIPHKGFDLLLLQNFNDEKVFAVGCMDESLEDGKIVPRGRGIGRWSRGFLQHSAGKLDKNNTLWVSGGSGAFRKKIWDELGGLEESFNPFYWEDIDLSYRGLKSGYKLMFEKESKVRHEHEKGAIKSEYTSSRIKRISYRNQLFFVWLNITDSNLLLSHFLWLPYNVLFTIMKRDFEFCWGLSKALIKLPQIMKTRSQRKKKFILKDEEILLPFTKEFVKP